MPPLPALAVVADRQGATLMRSVNTADSNKGRQKVLWRGGGGAKHNKAKKGRPSGSVSRHFKPRIEQGVHFARPGRHFSPALPWPIRCRSLNCYFSHSAGMPDELGYVLILSQAKPVEWRNWLEERSGSGLVVPNQAAEVAI